MEKKYCEVTGHEMKTFEELDKVLKRANAVIAEGEELLDEAIKSDRVIVEINNHFKERHSLNFIEFERILRDNGVSLP